MSPLIDRASMESVFGADALALDDRALTVIPHVPTRAYLREVGLPDREQWFFTSQDVVGGNLTVDGPAWQAAQQRDADCPFDRSAWLALGGIGMDDVIVDTGTGVVYCIPEKRSVHVLNSSVDALGFFLHALERERHAYDGDIDEDSGLDPMGAEQRLRTLMHSTDSVALENPDSSWHMVLHHVGNGLMFY